MRWARGEAASTARSRTAPPTSRRSSRGCCGYPTRRCSTTSGRRSSTPSTAGSRTACSCRTRSRRSGLPATAPRGAKLVRYPGLKEEYYLADFEPDRGRARASWASRAREILAVVRTAPSYALYLGGSETPLLRPRAASARPADERVQTVVLARTDEQRARRPRARPRARGRARARRGRPQPRRARRRARLGRRHDEPRGRRARHAGVVDVRGAARRRSTSSSAARAASASSPTRAQIASSASRAARSTSAGSGETPPSCCDSRCPGRSRLSYASQRDARTAAC